MKQNVPLISIVIPTMYRPEPLHTALSSAAAQVTPGYDIEIIVADNSAEGSAQTQVEAFNKTSEISIKYISEPKAGVANVRNAALTLVKGQYIAFLDDDQEASAGWLAALVKQCILDDSSAVFGFIEGRTDAPVKNAAARLKFFSREHDGLPSGLTEKFYGCGSSLINLSKIDPTLIHFDAERNESGGEDDALFGAIEHAGGTFSWSKDSHVYEDVPADRIRKRYICQRSFAYGQGPALICLEEDSYSIIGLTKWMTVGLVQMAIHFPLALITLPFENALHMNSLRKACEGAGKVFWQAPFQKNFYGQAAVAKLKKKASA